jgi:hypothetical protein
LEGLGIDGRIILEWIMGKQVMYLWAEFMWLRIGTSSRLVNIAVNLQVP